MRSFKLPSKGIQMFLGSSADIIGMPLTMTLVRNGNLTTAMFKSEAAFKGQIDINETLMTKADFEVELTDVALVGRLEDELGEFNFALPIDIALGSKFNFELRHIDGEKLTNAFASLVLLAKTKGDGKTDHFPALMRVMKAEHLAEAA